MLSWDREISPCWGKTVTSCLNGGYRVELGELPDELLPALSKFLIISKDEIDQGRDFLINDALKIYWAPKLCTVMY